MGLIGDTQGSLMRDTGYERHMGSQTRLKGLIGDTYL